MTEADIRAHLRPVAVVGRELRCFAQLDSTNLYVKAAAADGAAEGLVVTADCQTAGRGRLGRSFQSPANKGLYLTALLRPALPPEALLSVTALAGLAVCRAAGRLCGAEVGLKWPNDPVLNGKKLCGILAERSGNALAVGIGVNVSQGPEDFSPDVAVMATSLEYELGRRVDRAALAAALIEELDALYAALCAGETAPQLAEYRRRCVTLGRRVQLIAPDGTRETAEAVDVDARFGLTVRDAAGWERTVRSGEVSVRGLYGYID